MPNPKLVALGWNTSGTGFTRVLHEILRPLSETCEIHYIGIGHEGSVEKHSHWTLYPALIERGDVFGAFKAKEVIEKIQPDACFILHDIWMMKYYCRVLEPENQPFPTMVYFPLDGKVTDDKLFEPLLRCQAAVTYTPGACRQIEEGLERIAPQGPHPQVEAIPHGVDLAAFTPLFQWEDQQSRSELKQSIFPDLPNPESSLIILNASRPDKRKQLDRTLEGFALFAKNKPDNVRLCLHHAITTKEHDQSLREQARKLGIENRIHWNPLNPEGGHIADEELNRLYNACDIGLNTSSGEGWGLISFEHAATGNVQVVPNHSACAELWQDAAQLIEPAWRGVPEYSLLELAEVSAENVAQALEPLYQNLDLRYKLGAQGLERAHTPAWQWSAISMQWKALFSQLTA